jgi:hypothetical protein
LTDTEAQIRTSPDIEADVNARTIDDAAAPHTRADAKVDDSNTYLYRGDTRSPEEIHQAGGFSPWETGGTGSPEEIVHFVEGKELISGVTGSRKYVSTGLSLQQSADFGAGDPGYVYKIQNPGGGYSVTEAYNSLRLPVPKETQELIDEVAFAERIELEYIVEYAEVDFAGNIISDWLLFPK